MEVRNFEDKHLRNIVKQRLDKEFPKKCTLSKDGKVILVEKRAGGKVAVLVTKEGFQVVPLIKKKAFWPLALLIAFLIQVTAHGIQGAPKFLTIIAAFVLILLVMAIVRTFTSTYSKNQFFAQRIREYLDKELLTV
ncbi:MAG: hypothetical protein ACPGJS_16825 [Flammeovirgaceae bacterium]